eukprot:5693803-Prymnesium_polylepis.1
MQSVPSLQIEYSAPGPPSSQSPSDAYQHELKQFSAPMGVGKEGGGGGEGGWGGHDVVESVIVICCIPLADWLPHQLQ